MELGKASDSSLGLKGLAISEQDTATPSDEHGDGPSPDRVQVGLWGTVRHAYSWHPVDLRFIEYPKVVEDRPEIRSKD